MKKRWILFVVIIILAAGIWFLARSGEKKTEEVESAAMYLEFKDGSYIFVDTDSQTPFYAEIPEDLTEDGKKLEKEELQTGDLLKIFGNGIMLESYPGQYPGIFRMERTGTGDEDTIKQYHELTDPFYVETDENTVPDLSISYKTDSAIVNSVTTQGSYSFEFEKEDGSREKEEQDVGEILFLPELIESNALEDTEIELRFSRDPETVEVICYEESLREEKTDVLPEGKTVRAEVIQGEDGEGTVYRIASAPGMVYRIRAEFSNGTMEYGFWNTEG